MAIRAKVCYNFSIMNTLIILLAQYLYIVIILIVGIYFLYLSKEKKIGLLKILVIALPLIGILTLLGRHFIDDPRPFVVEHITPLIPHDPDNGFPSDHTLISMAAALIVFLNNKKAGIILILLALIVGTARVLAKVHHPLDIIGSVVIVSLSFAISWFFWQKIKRT